MLHIYQTYETILIRHWSGRGLKAILYLDDGIIAVNGTEKACIESAQVKLDLKKAGFIVNNDKCEWEAKHSMEWLGFNIDLLAGEFSVPAGKIDMLKAKLSAVQKARLVPARKVASLIGTIISMSLALGPVTHLMTRSMYAILNERISWCQKLTLSAEASDEIQFWLDKISHFNGHMAYTICSESSIF